MSGFRTGILITFGVFAVIGALLFAGFGGIPGGESSTRPITIWGTVDEGVMNELLKQLRSDLKKFATVTYVEKDPRTYEQDFVEALASGVGPDMLLLPQDLVLTHRNKIWASPYENFNERLFKDTFVEEGELFMGNTGIVGIPFMIDPMVLYWNRNIFSSEGIAQPPVFWEELFTLAPRLIKRDQASNILRSAIAFGEYTNVDHAKEIISALIIQAGSPIVERKEDGSFKVVLGTRFGLPIPPAEAALRFYTEFSNPVQAVYSWNRSLSRSKQAFIAGDLAMYVGFASELNELRKLNPNLNFDVAPLPQSKEIVTKSTFGTLTAMVIMRTSRSLGAAFQTSVMLSSVTAGEILSTLTTLPPVRRDLLSRPQTDAYKTVFYNSALIARGWLDPNRNVSDRIFQTMVEGVTSGRFRLQQAVQNAHRELGRELR